ncbi:hypothetical protein GW17_00011094 [Ensete ventricosum]|nr:hypothetical protein GW17_00011094 [Ensete ventricosum]
MKGELPEEGADPNGSPVAGEKVVEAKMEPEAGDWDECEVDLNRPVPVPATRDKFPLELADEIAPAAKEKSLEPQGVDHTWELLLPPALKVEIVDNPVLETKLFAGGMVLLLPELEDDPVAVGKEKPELEPRGFKPGIEKPNDELAEPDEEVPLRPNIVVGIDEPKFCELLLENNELAPRDSGDEPKPLNPLDEVEKPDDIDIAEEPVAVLNNAGDGKAEELWLVLPNIDGVRTAELLLLVLDNAADVPRGAKPLTLRADDLTDSPTKLVGSDFSVDEVTALAAPREPLAPNWNEEIVESIGAADEMVAADLGAMLVLVEKPDDIDIAEEPPVAVVNNAGAGRAVELLLVLANIDGVRTAELLLLVLENAADVPREAELLTLKTDDLTDSPTKLVDADSSVDGVTALGAPKEPLAPNWNERFVENIGAADEMVAEELGAMLVLVEKPGASEVPNVMDGATRAEETTVDEVMPSFRSDVLEAPKTDKAGNAAFANALNRSPPFELWTTSSFEPSNTVTVVALLQYQSSTQNNKIRTLQYSFI